MDPHPTDPADGGGPAPGVALSEDRDQLTSQAASLQEHIRSAEHAI